MPSKSIILYDPVLGLVSGPGDALLTLQDVDDKFFEIPDQTGNNQSAELDGNPVTINAIEQAIGPQLIVAKVGGVSVNLSLTPVRITVESGLIDDTYIYFPGLPDGAEILVGVSVPLLFPNDVAVPLCLAGDTLVRTAEGLRPIREIRPGDQVHTLDGGLQTVCWTGRQHVDFVHCPEMQKHLPIMIRKDAFGEGRPFCDLTVSPQHSVMFDGWEVDYFTGEEEVLAIAKSLVNGKSVVRLEDCAEIEYCHILFEQHHVIWAHGLPVESLFLGDLATDSLLTHKREELLDIFPNVAAMKKSFPQRVRARIKSFEIAAMFQGAA
ncbi:Hint domain-containing protein [Oceaniglobus trochenteri]|uniref:Hint domain-containing protein n=1 Tax=Oceaniglobus trochenteri TaxID=2763260 RepID=UPI001D0004BF|nr:Hint domain-containing protein [Oceaniglobus trochenteri]